MDFKIGDKLKINVNRNVLRITTFDRTVPTDSTEKMMDEINYKKPVIITNVNKSWNEMRVHVPLKNGQVHNWFYTKENGNITFVKYNPGNKGLQRARAVRKIRNNVLIGGKDARRTKSRERIS